MTRDIRFADELLWLIKDSRFNHWLVTLGLMRDLSDSPWRLTCYTGSVHWRLRSILMNDLRHRAVIFALKMSFRDRRIRWAWWLTRVTGSDSWRVGLVLVIVLWDWLGSWTSEIRLDDWGVILLSTTDLREWYEQLIWEIGFKDRHVTFARMMNLCDSLCWPTCVMSNQIGFDEWLVKLALIMSIWDWLWWLPYRTPVNDWLVRLILTIDLHCLHPFDLSSFSSVTISSTHDFFERTRILGAILREPISVWLWRSRGLHRFLSTEFLWFELVFSFLRRGLCSFFPTTIDQ
jgi:hypothetical protein